MGPMMRLILGLGVLVVIFAAVSLGLPAHVTVARSVVINAPEYAIYPYLNNLRRFSTWSPWAARDPNMKVTYSGPPEGVGSKLVWESDEPSVGTGSLEIVAAEQSKSIDMTADLNGLEGTSGFVLTPAGSGSKVTWTFGYATGSSPLKRWKALMLDGFVGAEYSNGLAKLKARVEEDRRPTAQPAIVPQPAPPPQAAPAGGETAVPRAEQAAPADAAPAEAPPPPQRR